MRVNSRFHLSFVAFAVMAALGATKPVLASDDLAKLEELKRAMSVPGGEGAPAKKKMRTRAIVMDSDPQPEETPAPRGGAPVDCASISPDVKANAVDFAIQFRVGRAELSPVSENTLIEIGKILALSPERCVLVEGHTDVSGNAEKNLVLSRERAASVVKFISDHGGVDRKRLVPIGKGSSDPLKNLDPRDPKNRRVVFKVVTG
ncbi:hypothetical protein B9N43_13650 [Denitratisoma sp. DHT3]|uniref:OmpA family protein n=1 Tax=Denitratisoma sp. DHT3 TaxID=1981880 RepID=UPI001198A49E|nr:OmpA family protein [Denitratisoma sp. DHT3]QDX82198.1 hypothetical protein B9N43_13650 [Denitratisoma sp. DHT3]